MPNIFDIDSFEVNDTIKVQCALSWCDLKALSSKVYCCLEHEVDDLLSQEIEIQVETLNWGKELTSLLNKTNLNLEQFIEWRHTVEACYAENLEPPSLEEHFSLTEYTLGNDIDHLIDKAELLRLTIVAIAVHIENQKAQKVFGSNAAISLLLQLGFSPEIIPSLLEGFEKQASQDLLEPIDYISRVKV